MKKIYTLSNVSLVKTNLKISTCAAFFLLAGNFVHAQQDRAALNSQVVAPLSYDASFTNNVMQQGSTIAANRSIALAGTYTVGAAGQYATLTAAVADFNSAPITGPVVFELLDASYPGETYPIVISANTGLSSANTLTIKPAAGVDATISGSSNSTILKIDAADYVTIDGSNNGTASRNLTLNNTFVAVTGTTPVIVWVASNASAGADFFTIKNSNIIGATPAGTIGGVISSGATLGGSGTVPNNNLTVENNQFNRAQNAVFAIGPTAATDDRGTYINNSIGSSNPADRMGFRGLAVQYAKNFVISGNTITGASTSSTSTAAGILVGAGITNGVVTNNQVTDVSNTNTGGYGAAGIYSNAATGTGGILISNNFVSNISGRGFDLGGLGDNGNGIVVGGAGTDIRIYHNTVNLNTPQTAAGRPSAINVLSTVTAAGALDVRNNIFVNNQTQTGQKYAIYSAAANTVFSNIDYNNYFTTGANLGYIGTARATLADVQAGFGGNAASLNVAPVFVSATDLHLVPASNTALDNLGTSISEVNTDIDGEARSATPDMGADEFTVDLAASNAVKSTLKFYPNPVTDYVTISNNSKINSAEIYTVTGQKIVSKKIDATTGTVDMRSLAPGMYLLKVVSGEKIQTIKLIKK